MNANKYAIFMDIDGTLLNSKHEIEPQTLKTLHALEQAGHYLFIATGRMASSAKHIAEKISTQTNFIASNGAMTHVRGEVISHPLLLENAQLIFKTATEFQLPLFFFGENAVYHTDILPSYFKESADRERIATGEKRAFHKLEDFAHIKEHHQKLINGIIISEDSQEKLLAAKKMLADYGSLNISSSAKNNIEITELNITKASAIAEIIELLEIRPEHTIAFGDGFNDIEMLEFVEHGVAMDNATDAVKKVAAHVTDSNNDEGIHKFLSSFFKLG